MAPPFLATQLTLFQPGGTLILPPPRFLDLPPPATYYERFGRRLNSRQVKPPLFIFKIKKQEYILVFTDNMHKD